MRRTVLTVSLALMFAGCSSGSSSNGSGGGAGGDEDNGGRGGPTAGSAGGSSTGGSGGASGGSGGSAGASGGSGGSAGASGGSGGSAGASGGSGGSTTADASTGDGGGGAKPDGGSSPDGSVSSGNVTCGTTPAAFDIKKLGGAEGFVVGPDGTVYFANFNNAVGRYRPPYDQAPEKAWAKVPDANAEILGVMIDPKKNVVYAGARKAGKLYRITVEDTPKIDTFATVKGGYNGLTLAADGSLFYTDQGSGNVFRVDETGKETQVTKTPVNNANGIAFGPDKGLYVLTWANPGVVTKLVLDANNMEMSREKFVELPKGNADGIAFDKNGAMYVTSGALWKVTPDKMVKMVDPMGGANVDFGAGALSCNDILWGNGRVVNDTPGMIVPWHQK